MFTNLTDTESHLLGEALKRKGLTVYSIEEIAHTDRLGASRLISRLRLKGFMEDSGRRRGGGILYTLTPLGADVAAPPRRSMVG